MDNDSRHQALVRAGKSLRVATVPTPSPPQGGLLVAPSFVGVCGTDLQILNGTRPDTAEILGHEGAGVVIKAGQGASVHEGQRVVFNPSAQLPKGRILGHNFSGLFQQYIPVDAQEVDDGLVQPLEDDLPTMWGPLVEPVAGVIYACDLIYHRVPALQSVVIFGAGPTGLITALYLRERGVRVLLIHTSQGRLDTAQALGLLDPESSMVFCDDLAARILAWSSGHPLDAALICTSMIGAPAALSHAVEVLRSGGCIELVSNFPATAPTPDGISAGALRAIRAANICGVPENGAYVVAEISGRQIAFTSHRGTNRRHLSRAMQVLRSKAQPYAALITHLLSLQEAADAITALAGARGTLIDGRDCIKAVVDLTRHAAAAAS
jgi:threonine dehydrogenase-like Zn-dependent dehydrogenase